MGLWQYEKEVHKKAIEVIARWTHTPPGTAFWFGIFLIVGCVGLAILSSIEAVKDELIFSGFGAIIIIALYLCARVAAPIELSSTLEKKIKELEYELHPPPDNLYSVYSCKEQYPQDGHNICEDKIEWKSPYMPINERFFIRIKPKRPTKLYEFNLRFIADDRLQNAPKDTINLKSITELVESRKNKFVLDVDHKGGYDIKYVDGVVIKEDESLWFEIEAGICEEWTGHLSFRWYDENHLCHFSRCPVKLTKVRF